MYLTHLDSRCKWSEPLRQCPSESGTFEVELGNGYTAEIDYDVRYRDEIGGSYENWDFEHITVIDYEYYEVLSVWDEEGNECPDIVKQLKEKLR